MMSARLKGCHINMTVIQCYAPTNDIDEEDKDAFYNQLDVCLVEAPKHDVLLVMEDLNAKVGSDNTHVERCLGKEGCGIRNDNGTRLEETCAHHNLVIGGTLFKHPDIHKLTWVSPNGRDINQIDHVMINGSWRRSLLDVVVRRGADINSEHYLVVASLRLKLRSARKKDSGPTRPDDSRLRAPECRRNLIFALKNRFNALLADNTNGPYDNTGEEIDESWSALKAVYSDANREVLAPRRRKNGKEWISAQTFEVLRHRRAIRKQKLNAKSSRLQERLSA